MGKSSNGMGFVWYFGNPEVPKPPFEAMFASPNPVVLSLFHHLAMV